MDRDQLIREFHEMWDAFPGMARLIRRFTEAGGVVCVVSHSVDVNIRRDYRENGLPEPDMVFGWDEPREERKPSPHALYRIMERFQLEPHQLLMVDDLKPGYDMARAAGVPFAAAGWAVNIPKIETFMRKNCGLYFKTVPELFAYLF